MISPSDCTMKRSTPCVDGWCGPMLRSISSSISLVNTTSVMGYLSCSSARPTGARLGSSFGRRLADLEKLERVGPRRRDAVVLVFFAVVLAQRVSLPVVGKKEPPQIGVPLEQNAEQIVALALLPVGDRPH